MIMIKCTPCLRVENYLHSLTVLIDNTTDVETTIKHFLQNMKLGASIHENVQFNVKQTQKKEKKTYATRKGK